MQNKQPTRLGDVHAPVEDTQVTPGLVALVVIMAGGVIGTLVSVVLLAAQRGILAQVLGL